MNKYKFSISDIVEWQENELEPFKIKGVIKKILEDLKDKGINPLTIKVIKNGTGYVIAEHQSIKERDKYFSIEKEHETLCLINNSLQKIQGQEDKLVKSVGTKDYLSAQSKIGVLKQNIYKSWLTLNNSTKEQFLNDVEPFLIVPPSETKQEVDKKYNHIFKDNGYELFEYLMKKYVRKNRGRVSDISFFYWKMYDANKIHQRPEVFKKWLYEDSIYKIYLGGKIKTLSQLKKQEDNRNEQFNDSLKIIK